MTSRCLLLVLALAAACGDDDGGGGPGDGGASDGGQADAAVPDAAPANLYPYACTLDIDSDLDGEPDERWTTSQEGMVRTIEVDTGVDGSIEMSFEQHYNRNGKVAQTSFESVPTNSAALDKTSARGL